MHAMPRRRSPPRLYLDPGRKTWAIRDGGLFVRLGLPEHERAAAERRLAAYLGEKYQPERGPDPLVCDVIGIYASEHLAHAATARNSAYSLGYLLRWWGTRRASEITVANCRAYTAAATSTATARKDLELLRAAVRHYSRSTGIPLQAAKLPTIGYLGTAAASAWAPWTAAFVQRLHELAPWDCKSRPSTPDPYLGPRCHR